MTDRVQLKVGNSTSNADLDQKLKVQHTRNVVGSYYEALAAHAFGAVRWNGGALYAYEQERGMERGEDSDPPCLIPDLLRRGDSTFIEVKGGNYRSQFKIFVWQAKLYDHIRRRGTYPIYRPRVEYAIFMHSLQKMTKRLKTPRRLIAELAGATLCGLLLDLDVVLRLSGWCGTAEYGGPESRQHYPLFYTLGSPHVWELMKNPRACLIEMGLNPHRFPIVRRYSGQTSAPLFERVMVGNTPLTPFPIVTIRRKRGPRPAYTGPVDESWLSHIHQETMFPPTPDMLDDLADVPF